MEWEDGNKRKRKVEKARVSTLKEGGEARASTLKEVGEAEDEGEVEEEARGRKRTMQERRKVYSV